MRLLPKSGAHRRRHARARPSLPRLALPRTTGTPASGSRLSVRRLVTAATGRVRSRAPHPRPVERRRARALLLASALFAAIVLLSALPWTTLLNQHAQLSSATAETNILQAENKTLSAQARELSDNATQSALARQDYGLVRPGQTAYALLPPPGSAPSSVVNAGHVPLDEAPVVPGSKRSEELLGAGVVSSATVGGPTRTVTAQGGRPTNGGAGHDGSPSGGEPSGGFWSRVGHTLEFWN